MGISVDIQGAELQGILAHIQKLNDPASRERLLDLIGAEVESQTHRRIRDEKTAPDGSAWPEWSTSYAATRHGNQSLLMGGGELDDSIQYLVRGKKVHVGSPLAYAAVHQEGFDGAVNISAHNRLIRKAFGKALKSPVWQTVKPHTRQMQTPQREYLGLSTENQHDLQALIGDFYGDILR